MLFAPSFARPVRQLFDNLNRYTPMECLNWRCAPTARRAKTPAICTYCAKPPGESFAQYVTSRRNTPNAPQCNRIRKGIFTRSPPLQHMNSILPPPPLARRSSLRLQSIVRCRPRHFRRTTRQQLAGPVAQRLEQGTHKGKWPFSERPSKKR